MYAHMYERQIIRNGICYIQNSEWVKKNNNYVHINSYLIEIFLKKINYKSLKVLKFLKQT